MTGKGTVARGYGAEHRAKRAQWATLLDQGHTQPCACQHTNCPHHTGPCPVLITATTPWDLGHTDDRQDWTGPECQPCNRSAGATNSRATTQHPMTTRPWATPRGAA